MKLNHNGSTNVLPIAVLSVGLFLTLVFSIWAFSGYQKYKNNTNQIVAVAVTNANAQQQAKDNAAFKIASENPLINYTSSADLGSISVNYPRTWSSYVNTTSGTNLPLDGYFYPGTLPTVTDSTPTNYALRLQVSNQAYSEVVNQYSNQQASGQVTVSPYSLPKLPKVIGVQIVGTLSNGKSGTLVILPLRSQSLLIWTEGTQFLSDFNNSILPSATFSP